ncbi:ABC transporter ATP-binding protein [Paenibacillus bouchesdurhonensis]|uniref:ABC transporter ATP-binding protein n=1 Tax=Paenibacillus bouchesdurhonensis TaxID=1870990 RepID=UPI000DA62824|nr:ABC transporter ATP-binding protein [Paenibacillus bouchesdurhonensis]
MNQGDIRRLSLDSLRHIKLIFMIGWKAHPRLMSVWIFIMFILAFIPTVQIWLHKTLIDQVSTLSTGQGSIYIVMFSLFIYYGSGFVLVTITEIQKYIYTIVQQDANMKMKHDLLKKINDVPLQHFEDHAFFNQMTMAQTALNLGCFDFIQYLFQGMRTLLTIISVFGLLAYVSWALPLGLIASTFPGILLLFIAKKKRFRFTLHSTEEGREMDYLYRLLQLKESAREIRIFQLAEHLISRWKQIQLTFREFQLKNKKQEALGGTFGSMFMTSSAIVVGLLLLWQVKDGAISIGSFVALIASVLTIQGMVGSLGAAVMQLWESLFNLNHYYSFLNKNIETEQGTLSFPKPHFHAIEFQEVSFRYGNHKESIRNVSLQIRQGEKIAIVGENGAGKTTLVQLMLGLYSPTQGRILIGGLDIREIDQTSFLANVTCVFQDFVRYRLSLRDNVGFGQLAEIENDEKIRDVLENTGLNSLVKQLPKGLETKLSSQFISGQELSGGQWQRVAIARALMKNAEIVILDEPTAALDPRTEVDIIQQMHQLSNQKTSIIISHRLGPARLCDRIIVMKQGEIIEIGNHKELLSLNGEYAKMYHTQSQWYQDTEIESRRAL